MLEIALAVLSIQDPQTASTTVRPTFMDGVHAGCEAVFNVIYQDTAYFRGEYVGASGSFTLYNWPDGSRIFVGMKLGIYADQDGGWLPPSNAYVVNGFRTNIEDQRANIEAESPDFRLFVFDVEGPETINAISRIATEGRLDVAYTIGDGSMPTTFPVMFSNTQTEEWLDCVTALTRRDE